MLREEEKKGGKEKERRKKNILKAAKVWQVDHALFVVRGYTAG